VNADFEYNIDLNDPDKEQAVADANIAFSNFVFKTWNETIKNWEYDGFTDESVKRQLKFLNVVGTAALNEADLRRVKDTRIIIQFHLKFSSCFGNNIVVQ